MAEFALVPRTDINPKLTGPNSRNPRTFKSEDELLEKFTSYIEWVKETGYQELPTQTNFAKWCGTNSQQVFRALHLYYRDSRGNYDRILSEALSEGAALGKYKEKIIMFCLKNWCDWADKSENVNYNKNEEIASTEEAERELNEYLKTVREREAIKVPVER